MYKPKKLQIKGTNSSGDRIVFNLDLRGTVTIIRGYSSTGKTLLCKMARQMIEGGNEDIVVLGPSEGSTINSVLSEYRNKIIIIDNADICVGNKVLEHILQDENNYYILMRRNNYGIELSPNYYATLEDDGNMTVKLKYKWNEPRWY